MRRRDWLLLGFFVGAFVMDWWWHQETAEHGMWEWRPIASDQ